MSETYPPDDLQAKLTAARSDLEEFERMISDVVTRNHRSYFPGDFAEHLIDNDPVLRWRLVDDFFDPYITIGRYDLANLPRLAYRIIDLKLQYYNVAQIMPGIHNHLLGDSPFSLAEPLETPGLYLQHLCLMQAWIAQARILWDRLMSFIFILEEGREPGKSIRKDFFKSIPSWCGRWDQFLEFERRIDKYDRIYRTPEFHKNSVLRASLTNQEPIDPNEIAALVSPVMNGFWGLLIDNINGIQSNIISLGRTIDPEFDLPEPDDPPRPHEDE
jgi:hypothetical protein